MGDVLPDFRWAEETLDGKLTDDALQAMRNRVAKAANPPRGFFC